MLLGDNIGGVAVVLQSIRLHCVVSMDFGWTHLHLRIQLKMRVYSIPTLAKSDLHRTFRNVTVAYVGVMTTNTFRSMPRMQK